MFGGVKFNSMSLFPIPSGRCMRVIPHEDHPLHDEEQTAYCKVEMRVIFQTFLVKSTDRFCGARGMVVVLGQSGFFSKEAFPVWVAESSAADLKSQGVTIPKTFAEPTLYNLDKSEIAYYALIDHVGVTRRGGMSYVDFMETLLNDAIEEEEFSQMVYKASTIKSKIEQKYVADAIAHSSGSGLKIVPSVTAQQFEMLTHECELSNDGDMGQEREWLDSINDSRQDSSYLRLAEAILRTRVH